MFQALVMSENNTIMEPQRDTCDEIETEFMNTKEVETKASLATTTTTRIREREDDEGELRPNTLDRGFFPDFDVDGCLWDVWDKIDVHGFVYVHQASGRPLAITKTLDRNSHEYNGYCFWFQLILDKVEEISLPFGEKDGIKLLLKELDNKYNVLGDWLKDIVDDRLENDKSIPNTEKEDEIEHTSLYNTFLNAIGITRIEHEKRPKIVTAKRRNNNNNSTSTNNIEIEIEEKDETIIDIEI